MKARLRRSMRRHAGVRRKRTPASTVALGRRVNGHARSHVPVAEVGPFARDVMLRSPDTVLGDMTVAAAWRLLDNPRLRMLLVADDGRLMGVVSRERLAGELDGELTLDRLADAQSPRVRPDETVARVLDLLETADTERLPVVATTTACSASSASTPASGVLRRRRAVARGAPAFPPGAVGMATRPS